MVTRSAHLRGVAPPTSPLCHKAVSSKAAPVPFHGFLSPSRYSEHLAASGSPAPPKRRGACALDCPALRRADQPRNPPSCLLRANDFSALDEDPGSYTITRTGRTRDRWDASFAPCARCRRRAVGEPIGTDQGPRSAGRGTGGCGGAQEHHRPSNGSRVGEVYPRWRLDLCRGSRGTAAGNPTSMGFLTSKSAPCDHSVNPNKRL